MSDGAMRWGDGARSARAEICLSKAPVFVLVNVPVQCSTLCEKRAS
jgi:hypothetical protein